MTERQAWPIDEFGPPDENGDRRIRLRGGTVLNVPAAELATAGITPPPDPVDYPDGMVIRECDSTAVYYRKDGEWCGWNGFPVTGVPNPLPGDGGIDVPEWVVLYVPAPPSNLDALHTLGLADIRNMSWAAIVDRIVRAQNEAAQERGTDR